jgi:hypothetical protein
MKKLLDLKLFGLVAFLAFALVFIGVDFIEGQAKKGKPDKPSKSKTEWIAFTGDLVGGQAVEGCCPNDGPWPEYEMILGFEVDGFPPGTYYDGQLFINRYGAGRNQKYKVQFWNDDIAIEIIGGVIDDDKQNKVLTVTFTDETCVELFTGTPIAVVTFTLVRSPY